MTHGNSRRSTKASTWPGWGFPEEGEVMSGEVRQTRPATPPLEKKGYSPAPTVVAPPPPPQPPPGSGGGSPKKGS